MLARLGGVCSLPALSAHRRPWISRSWKFRVGMIFLAGRWRVGESGVVDDWLVGAMIAVGGGTQVIAPLPPAGLVIHWERQKYIVHVC